MKQFFKTFAAALLANIVGSGCAIFLFFIGLVSLVVGSIGALATKTSSPVVAPQAHSILKIDASTLSDVVSEDPFASFNPSKSSQPLALSTLIDAVRKAKNHPNIKAIYLNVEDIDAGMASLEELRRALADFKKSGKPVVAYADSYSQKAYYLASVANQLLLNPQGAIYLNGIASGRLMYKDALDKLGVKMEVFKVGTFKSAVEPYIMNEMSEANKLQTQEYIDGLWSSIVSAVAEGRGIVADSVRAYADRGIAFSAPETFVQTKLADKLSYRSDVAKLIAERLKLSASDLSMISAYDMSQVDDSQPLSLGGDVVKVIFAEGEITDVAEDYFSTASTIGYKLVKQLDEAREDESIKTVVLRVNSPGGSAFLSDQIWYAVSELRKKKPVVVSMGDFAASGGYYISAPANMIVAEANTLTGSIGIFGMIPNASELATKLGVNMDIVKTSTFADLEAGIPFRPMTEGQRALIQRQVERGYDTFLGRVSEGRKISKTALDSIAQGRVWLGKRAKELGLVDKLGGLDTAIQEAAKLAKLSKYDVDYGVRSLNPLLELFESASPSDEFVARVRGAFLTEEEKSALRLMKGITRYAGVQARLPYDLATY